MERRLAVGFMRKKESEMPYRTGQTGRRENELSPYRRWQNDAELALAATRDYPKATAGLILAVGALAFVAGYLMRSNVAESEN
jgi:hypothetical protein